MKPRKNARRERGNERSGGRGKPARSGGRSGAPRGESRGDAGRGKPRRTNVKHTGRQRELDGTQVEGRQAVREMLIAQKRRVHEVYVSDDIDNNPIVDDIIALAKDQRVPLHRVARKDIERMARSEAPQGVVAMGAELPEADIADFVRTEGSTPFIVAIDGVTDPGNLGAILRSCDGAGVTGVILPKHRAVHITPSAAKSAAGAAEYVPMALVSGLPTALRQLKEAGVWIVGLHDSADKSVFEFGSLATEPICLVLGAEGPGLSRLVRERCDMLLSIPMLGALSSLNVSAAAALATYEVVRARRS
jgi:23S rRNA (guanosine2251-2'-O)-methyltransferase